MTRTSMLLLALAFTTCAPDEREESSGPETYETVGTVIRVEGEHVLIVHEDIPGFMDAMTMTFPVTDSALLEGLEAGRG